MARTVNTTLQDLFIVNYLRRLGNIAAACRDTVKSDGKPLSQESVRLWKKDPKFRRKLADAELQWRESLFSVCFQEAIGAVKAFGPNGEVLERHRPEPLLLMFLMKALEPETYDDGYRLRLLKLEGSAKFFTKHPLPKIKFVSEPIPERFKNELEQSPWARQQGDAVSPPCESNGS